MQAWILKHDIIFHAVKFIIRTVTKNVTLAIKSNHNNNYENFCLQRAIDFLLPFKKKNYQGNYGKMLERVSYLEF